MITRYSTWAAFRIDNENHLQFGFATRHSDGRVHSSCTGLEVMSTWTMSGTVRTSGIDSNFWSSSFRIGTERTKDVVVKLDDGLQDLLTGWIDGNTNRRTWELNPSGYNESVWCMVDIRSERRWTSQNGQTVASYTWTLCMSCTILSRGKVDTLLT
jgi:hypothetical protein